MNIDREGLLGGAIFWITIIIIIIAFRSCSKEPEETEEYKQGYDVGYDDGHDDGLKEGKKKICDEVEYRLNSGAANAVGC